MSDNILEFKRKIKESAPVGEKFVTIVIDGDDTYLEHSDGLDGYQVLGILEFAKSIKLFECQTDDEL